MVEFNEFLVVDRLFGFIEVVVPVVEAEEELLIGVRTL
jgi:hypothetical protein